MKTLTSKQRDVLLFIRWTVDERGYPPSVQEVADHIGVASTSTAHFHLAALRRKGYIQVGPGPRAITVLKP